MDRGGQWVYGNKVSRTFDLVYSGQPSLFEATVRIPKDTELVELRIMAADQVGNTGIHAMNFRVSP